MAGTAHKPACSGNVCTVGYLRRFDSGGKVLWFKTFSVLAQDQFAAAAPTSDAGFLAVGHVITSPGNCRPWLVKVGSSGVQQWEKIGPDAPCQRPGSIVPAGDGGWSISGTSTDTFGAFRLWWRRVDPLGNTVAEQFYAHPGGGVIAGSVRPTLDMGDGVAIGGVGTTFSATHLVLVRADQWGNASCTAAGLCSKEAVKACDDGDPCTADLCTPTKGCVQKAFPCDDGDVCTTDSCTPSGGCVLKPKLCNDDGDPCTKDSCVPGVGCLATPVGCDGSACAPKACTNGGTDKATAGWSCKSILAANPAAKSGSFWIDPAGTGAFQVYCNMTDQGGGWALVARMTNGCMTDMNAATGTLTSPTQAACAKLSDPVINQIRTGGDGVLWGWHDNGGTYKLPASGRFLKIISGSFDASKQPVGLTQQCSCQAAGPFSAAYEMAPSMAGVGNHNTVGLVCNTVGQTGCDSTSAFGNALFLYQHTLNVQGTFPSSSHGVPGGSSGWLYLR